MVVTLNLPPDIERAFQVEAEARSLSLDEFLSEVLLSRAVDVDVVGQHACTGTVSPRMVFEDGVPVLRTGHPIEISVVDETLASIRRERDDAILGRIR